MADASTDPTPPAGLPDSLVSELDRLNTEELRKTIIHAQELLNAQEESRPLVEPAPGEDILRVTERDGYTEVVKKMPCDEDCNDCLHGPYLYHVKERATPDGGSKTFWTLIGEIQSDRD